MSQLSSSTRFRASMFSSVILGRVTRVAIDGLHICQLCTGPPWPADLQSCAAQIFIKAI